MAAVLIGHILALTGDSVAVSVQAVDVRSDHTYWPTHVDWPVTPAACAINVAGDRHARIVTRMTAGLGLSWGYCSNRYCSCEYCFSARCLLPAQ